MPGGMTVSQWKSVHSNVGKMSGEELLSMFVGNPDRSSRHAHFLPLVEDDMKKIGELMIKASMHKGG